MKLPETLRSLIPLAAGLAVGAVGAVLFMESMPGAEGSPEERARELEVKLKRAENRIAALEADDPEHRGSNASVGGGRRTRRTMADEARNIAADLKEGRPVNPDDIFRLSKPLLKDLAPLFDRMRVKQQRELIDGMTGELARKYNLQPQQQAALREWFEKRAEEEAQRWSEMLTSDHTRIEDMVRATQNVRPDDGIEIFMAGILPADQLEAFKSERLAERAERVQREADMKVQRVDSIVSLDEGQRDQIFALMARGSRDYDPAMMIEGPKGEIGWTPGGNPRDSMLAVLRPDQRAAYEAEQKRRYDQAAKEAEAFGLALPPTWEMLDDSF